MWGLEYLPGQPTMTSAVSFNPAILIRVAMEEEIQRLRVMRDEVDPMHPNAEPYKLKVNQIADTQTQLDVIARKAPNTDIIESIDAVSNEKSDVRTKVWQELRKVALPDSRFHCKTYVIEDYPVAC